MNSFFLYILNNDINKKSCKVVDVDEVPSGSKMVTQQLTVYVSVYTVQMKTQGTFRRCILWAVVATIIYNALRTCARFAMRSVMPTT